MGKKLYEETEEGGIYFKSERKPWEVRVPNYVYDLWMPVLGVVDIGVYSVYCRLERENIVKAITLKDIARACRIGKSRLYNINKRLERCGFIQVAPPEGWQRLAHHTTEITVYDPPEEVPAWAIKEYVTDKIQGEYQPLSPWLVEDETQTEPPEVPNGTSEGTRGDADEGPDGTPNIETLGLKPLGVETLDVESDFPSKNQSADSSKSPRSKADPMLMELERRTAQNPSSYAAPLSAGGADALADAALFALYSVRGKKPVKKGTHQWDQQRFRLSEALKAYGYEKASVQLVDKAAEIFCKRKGEWTNVFYPSFAMDYGQALSDAEELLEKAQTRRARDIEATEASTAALEERKRNRAPPVEDDEVGQAVKAELALQMTRATFQTWVQPAQFVQEDGTLHVTAPDGLTRDWLADRLARSIQRAAVGVLGREVAVEFEVMP